MKRECLMKESVKVRSERSLSLCSVKPFKAMMLIFVVVFSLQNSSFLPSK